MGTKTIEDAEIFAVGRWNSRDFTSDDVDAIVSSFATLGLGGKVPLKLGHDGPDERWDDDGQGPLSQFSFGWVKKLRREGDKILATLEVPERVAEFIDDGFLNYVSVELLRDVRAGTRVIPWVLDAVALLGTDQPAVGILKGLRESLLKMTSEMLPSHEQYAARVSFSREGTSVNHSGDDHKMSDASAIEKLSEQISALTLKVNKLSTDNENLTKENKDLKGVKEEFTSLKSDVHKERVEAHRATIINRLEAAVKAEDIQPAIREKFTRIYKVDDNDHVMDVKMDDVELFIKNNKNPFKKEKSTKDVVSLSKSSDAVPEGTDVQTEISLRVEARLREANVREPTSADWQRETLLLFRSNPDLGQRYRTAVNEAIEHPSARG